MSMIEVNSQAVEGVRSKAPGEDVQSPVPHRGPDHAMAHAWSIGVTEAGREWVKPAEQKTQEVCPPEVYIG